MLSRRGARDGVGHLLDAGTARVHPGAVEIHPHRRRLVACSRERPRRPDGIADVRVRRFDSALINPVIVIAYY
jgi:hypothetical protein